MNGYIESTKKLPYSFYPTVEDGGGRMPPTSYPVVSETSFPEFVTETLHLLEELIDLVPLMEVLVFHHHLLHVIG